MKDHSAARMLSDLYEADGLGDMDFGDFTALVAEAAADPEGLSGGPAPAGYDPGNVYEALVSERVAYDLEAATQRIGAYFGARDEARHASARAGVMSASGANDEDYEAALAADAAGDPSPLLAMRTRYMSTI